MPTAINQANIQTAVDLWVSDEGAATTTYGHISDWDTSAVTDMSLLFFSANNFNSDISGWDVSSVTNMNSMFRAARAFNQNIGQWDVSKVEDMGHMFRDANDFNQDINRWDVSNVTNMSLMFISAGAFDQSIQYWDTTSVTDYTNMFHNAAAMLARGLIAQPDSSHFNQPRYQFADKNALQTAVDAWVSNQSSATSTYDEINTWDTSQVTDMSELFKNKTNFNSNISGWDVSNVTNMYRMFYYAENFNQDISNWNTSNVTNMSNMFREASKFNNGDSGNNSANPLTTSGSSWDVSSVTNMNSMFRDARAFNQDIGNWDVSSVTTMNGLFWIGRAFNQDISGWDVSSVTDMTRMFVHADAFNQDISGWDVSSVNGMYAMFYNSAAMDHPLQYWNTSSVTNYDSMFYGATAMLAREFLVTPNSSHFNQVRPFQPTTKQQLIDAVTAFTSGGDANVYYNVPINDWDTSLITDMSSLFQDKSTFNSNISDWDVSSVSNMEAMFSGANDFNQPLNDWDVSSVTKMRNMFLRARNFNQSLNDWDVSNVNNMRNMFDSANAFNGDINSWTLRSSGLSMQEMFKSASVFNVDITTWDTSGVTTMQDMFKNATAFDQDIQYWKTNHSSFNNMFSGATAMLAREFPATPSSTHFNKFPPMTNDNIQTAVDLWVSNQSSATATYGDISTWNTSAVTDMSNLFSGARNSSMQTFNSNISNWIVSSVINMSGMFRLAQDFNIDISGWERQSGVNGATSTSTLVNVTNMNAMFMQASDFNQDISNWNVSNVTNMSHMFRHTRNFNQPISKPIGGWDVSSVTNMGWMFANSQFNKDLSWWNVSNVTSFRAMFENGNYGTTGSTSNPTGDEVLIRSWAVSETANLDSIFYNNHSHINVTFSNAHLEAQANNRPKFNQTRAVSDYINAGYTLAQLFTIYTSAQLRSEGYTAQQLFTAQASSSYMNGGFSVSELITGGYQLNSSEIPSPITLTASGTNWNDPGSVFNRVSGNSADIVVFDPNDHPNGDSGIGPNTTGVTIDTNNATGTVKFEIVVDNIVGNVNCSIILYNKSNLQQIWAYTSIGLSQGTNTSGWINSGSGNYTFGLKFQAQSSNATITMSSINFLESEHLFPLPNDYVPNSNELLSSVNGDDNMKLLSGFTVSELSSDFTANDMKTASVSATDMKTAFDAGSYTISQITTGGYLLGELLTAAFSVSDLSSQFTVTEMKIASVSAANIKLGFDAGNYNISQIKAGAYGITELLNGSFTMVHLSATGGFNVAQMKAASISAANIKLAFDAGNYNISQIKAGAYGITELLAGNFTITHLSAAGGFNASEMKTANIDGSQVKGFYDIHVLKEANYTISDLFVTDGFSITELSANNSNTGTSFFNVSEMKAASISAADMKLAFTAENYTISEIKASYSITDLFVTNGFSMSDLSSNGGFSVTQMKDASISAADMKLAFTAGNYTISQIKASYSITELFVTNGFSITELSSTGGFSVAQMKAAPISAADMKLAFTAGNYTISQIKTGGYTLVDTSVAGRGLLFESAFSVAELKNDFFAADMFNASVSAVSVRPHYDLSDIINGGYDLVDTSVPGRGLLQAFSVANLKNDFNASEMKTAGVSISDAKAGTYTLTELKDSSYTFTEISSEYNFVELSESDGYTVSEMNSENVTAANIKIAFDAENYDISQIKAGGYGITELLAGNFTMTHLSAAGGFTVAEMKTASISAANIKGFYDINILKAGGYTLVDSSVTVRGLLQAFSVAELKNDFTANEMKTAGKVVADLYDSVNSLFHYTTQQLSNAYSISELISHGVLEILDISPYFSVSQMFGAQVSSADIKPSVGNTTGYTITTLKANGYVLVDSSVAGRGLLQAFSVAELKNDFSATEMNTAGVSISDAKTGTYSLAQLKASSYTFTEISGQYSYGDLSAGYTELEMFNENVSAANIRIAIENGTNFTLASVKSVGTYTLVDSSVAGRGLLQAFSVTELKNVYSAKEMFDANVSAADVRTNYSVTILKNTGTYTLVDSSVPARGLLFESAFSVAELKDDYSASEMQLANVSPNDLKGFYAVTDITSAYGISVLTQEGTSFTLTDFKGQIAISTLKPQYSVAQFKAALYTTGDLSSDFTISELKPTYSLNEMKEGFSIDIVKLNYTLFEMFPEYTTTELINAGFTRRKQLESGAKISAEYAILNEVFYD